jgi:hypothetical protein
MQVSLPDVRENQLAILGCEAFGERYVASNVFGDKHKGRQAYWATRQQGDKAWVNETLGNKA